MTYTILEVPYYKYSIIYPKKPYSNAPILKPHSSPYGTPL